MRIHAAELEGLAELVAAAGLALASSPRRAGFALKPDGSPVTEADIVCERALTAALGARFPGLPVVGEESAPSDGRLPSEDVIALIDPLDGTRAFADGGDDYCVCLAIVRGGEPVAGVLGAPARATIYAGAREAGGSIAWRCGVGADGKLTGPRTLLRTRRARRPPVALASDRHGDSGSEAMLARLGVERTIRLSSALKFAMLAEGEADIYARFAPTMAWDTAAGQAVLAAAGGGTYDAQGAALRYPAGGSLRNQGFVAIGDSGLLASAGLMAARGRPL